MLVNARMSPQSFARWQRAPALARQVLGGFARDATRLRALGARAVTAPVDLKDAVPLPAQYRKQIQVVGVTLHWADEPTSPACSLRRPARS